ncbi:hypothetical protein QA648_21320 (plasmid) [Rhizobium sp. CB3171]|uniref:hypothetical protein n=1 Tax=Rhizobium sp. CB3171 TaxID=3039157 RepID=UPI0024B0CC28|nr:hypothetical protein [Rhizobium sp. CB3171]WFU05716.1 hypothetical protein QA648_21320 [Rhizobium sp. CB3171]
MKLFIITLLLVSMTACSDEQQTKRQIRALLSWTATADMALDGRAKMLVSKSFTALTMERCGKEIGSLSKELPTSPQDLTALAGRLNTIIGATHDDIVNDRIGTVSQHLEDLRGVEAELKASAGTAQ